MSDTVARRPRHLGDPGWREAADAHVAEYHRQVEQHLGQIVDIEPKIEVTVLDLPDETEEG